MVLKLVILDVDGCLTDGKIYDKEHNVVGKVFNDLDMTAIKLFKCQNIDVVLLTSDEFNLGMANKRHLKFYNGCVLGKIDKLKVYEQIKKDFKVKDDEVCYLGDDRFDIPVLNKVWSFCPSNSPEKVMEFCTVVLKGRSGENLVSEMFDYFLNHGIVKEPELEDLAQLDLQEKR